MLPVQNVNGQIAATASGNQIMLQGAQTAAATASAAQPQVIQTADGQTALIYQPTADPSTAGVSVLQPGQTISQNGQLIQLAAATPQQQTQQQQVAPAGGAAAAAAASGQAGGGNILMMVPGATTATAVGNAATAVAAAGGTAMHRIPLAAGPELLEEEPLYVNAKQYHRYV